MRKTNTGGGYVIIILILGFTALTSCNTWVMPAFLPGTYTGTEKIISRHQKEGQYIFFEDNVSVSLVIGNDRQVTGTVGGATFEGCNIDGNRGWIGRELHIKTDYIIRGRLSGSTFNHDTILMKDISIPFNVENGDLKGSLFLTSKNQNLPIISILKLIKQ